ncbi:MAG: methylmalonyl Co-A mutase-associated GTPase MeaB [Rhodobacteraceae bacterium]|nr:MAG: methylmalonyl Co-A mutase-associated GTPase MeaB [Paracoccaceae bacterium]
MSADDPLARVAAGGKAALARALAALEARPDAADTVALLDAAWAAPRGQALGLTGPPGVGKSTLIDALIRALRAQGRRVAVIAVDPSSRRTRGALLGDRTRLSTDPDDGDVFVRSMAARDRLGGLSAITFPALVLMRALYDVVIVETVGVGQSETEIADVADTVVFCAQPGSGDALQFMKAGVMEIPHLAVVTKADMGAPARRALADLKGALSLAAGGDPPPAMALSATTGEGVADLAAAIEARIDGLAASGALAARRRDQAAVWARGAVAEAFGAEGVARIGLGIGAAAQSGGAKGIPAPSPFRVVRDAKNRLMRALDVGLSGS